METLYYVTALSNLARGYEKYAGRYDKARIPESTFPGQFFLLRREELHIGLQKATALTRKTGLTGDRPVVLQTHADTQALTPNVRTGLGRCLPGSSIEIDGLHFVDAAGHLEPVLVEDAMATSYQVLGERLRPFSALRPRSISILPVARACQARCPFCFSKASASAEVSLKAPDWSRINEVLSEAKARGAERAVITGGGEPSLLKAPDLEHLIACAAKQFSKVVLISNGAIWGGHDGPSRRMALERLSSAGLSVLSISRHHFDSTENAKLMGLTTHSERIAEAKPPMKLRWVCVLQRGGIDTRAMLEQYLDWSVSMGVDEICFKELYVSTSTESVYHERQANLWSREHQVPLRLVVDFAREHGWSVSSRLPWGSPIYEGLWRGKQLRAAAYTEPTVTWERTTGQCRSWNLMADGNCLASLEDRSSEVLAR